MKNIFKIGKKIIKIILLILLSAYLLHALVLIIYSTFFTEKFVESNLGNRDTIAILGDGKYELGKFNKDISLIDRRFNDGEMRVIVGSIEKYSIKNQSIYIIGYYGTGTEKAPNGKHYIPISYYDYNTGKLSFYTNDEPVPRYLILNVETEELQTYNNLDKIPETDRKVFENLE